MLMLLIIEKLPQKLSFPSMFSNSNPKQKSESGRKEISVDKEIIWFKVDLF